MFERVVSVLNSLPSVYQTLFAKKVRFSRSSSKYTDWSKNGYTIKMFWVEELQIYAR